VYKDRKDLSLKTWYRILDQFIDKDLTITLSGGEPTLRKDLFQLILYVRSHAPLDVDTYKKLMKEKNPDKIFEYVKKTKLTITTNGEMLTESMIDDFRKQGVTVWASLDTVDEKTFSKIRCGGNLKVILKNLTYATSKIPVHVNYVVMEENKNDAIDTINFLNRIGARMIRVTAIKMLGNAVKNNVSLYHKSYYELMNKIVDHFGKKHLNLSILFVLSPTYRAYLILNNKYNNIVRKIKKSKNIFIEEHFCKKFMDLDRAAVDANGDLMGCCNAQGIKYFKMGNLSRQKLSECWNKAEKRDMFFKLPEDCNGCRFKKTCNGGCRLVSYETKRDCHKKDPTCPFEFS